MYDNLTRNQVRQFFFDAWNKFEKHHALSPLEQVAVDWTIQHPEYHSEFENISVTQEREYLPEDGKTNPFLHLSMHLSISEQVAIDQPAGIRGIYYTLIRQTGSEHSASHKIMDCLGEMIWSAQKNRRPYDVKMYIESIEALTKTAN